MKAKVGVRPVQRQSNFRKKTEVRENRGIQRPISPIIIPSTSNSELYSWKVAENKAYFGLQFKITEKGGKTVKRMLQRSNPTASSWCESGGLQSYCHKVLQLLFDETNCWGVAH